MLSNHHDHHGIWNEENASSDGCEPGFLELYIKKRIAWNTFYKAIKKGPKVLEFQIAFCRSMLSLFFFSFSFLKFSMDTHSIAQHNVYTHRVKLVIMDLKISSIFMRYLRRDVISLESPFHFQTDYHQLFFMLWTQVHLVI